MVKDGNQWRQLEQNFKFQTEQDWVHPGLHKTLSEKNKPTKRQQTNKAGKIEGWLSDTSGLTRNVRIKCRKRTPSLVGFSILLTFLGYPSDKYYILLLKRV